MVYLQNEELKVQISEKGAELQSVVTKEGRECIWNGDPAYWTGRAPMLFPICGRLRDNKYIYGGKEYTMPGHGFAKNMVFDVEQVNDNTAVFVLRETEETMKIYPFAFELRVKYELDGKNIKVTYKTDNKNDYDMYFSIGAHEGYMCEGGIEDYYIEFDKNVTLDSYAVVGPIINHETTRIIENTNILPIKNEYFAVDALVMKNIDFDALTIKHNGDGKKNVRVEFPGFSSLLIWTIPGAPYICIEPWCGIPDSTDTDYIFETKEAIEKLAKGESFTRTHTLCF